MAGINYSYFQTAERAPGGTIDAHSVQGTSCLVVLNRVANRCRNIWDGSRPEPSRHAAQGFGSWGKAVSNDDAAAEIAGSILRNAYSSAATCGTLKALHREGGLMAVFSLAEAVNAILAGCGASLRLQVDYRAQGRSGGKALVVEVIHYITGEKLDSMAL